MGVLIVPECRAIVIIVSGDPREPPREKHGRPQMGHNVGEDTVNQSSSSFYGGGARPRITGIKLQTLPPRLLYIVMFSTNGNM